jgi:hypothetical protein
MQAATPIPSRYETDVLGRLNDPRNPLMTSDCLDDKFELLDDSRAVLVAVINLLSWFALGISACRPLLNLLFALGLE